MILLPAPSLSPETVPDTAAAVQLKLLPVLAVSARVNAPQELNELVDVTVGVGITFTVIRAAAARHIPSAAEDCGRTE